MPEEFGAASPLPGASPRGLRLKRLRLTDFRNYADLDWHPGGRICVVHGPNGSGKTNLLEAISLLVPGRGLRGARIADVALREGARAGRWGVAAHFDTPDGPLDIGTGAPPDGPLDRRVFRLDGEAPRTQSEIAARVSAVWLTPQMDRIFSEGASGRRRFLDRLVIALQPGHAKEQSAYETALSQRNRLLAEGVADPLWLDGLEDAMARHGTAVAAARAMLEQRLNEGLAIGAAGGFPPARLIVTCPVAARLAQSPAIEVEDWYRVELSRARPRDAAAGAALMGVHRADMTLRDRATGLSAADSSTGQQKALLLSVILGHAGLLARLRGVAPMLLLDEPAVHLDAARRAALFEALKTLPAQVFLTGTDADIFAPLRDFAAGYATQAESSLGALEIDAKFGVKSDNSASSPLS